MKKISASIVSAAVLFAIPFFASAQVVTSVTTTAVPACYTFNSNLSLANPNISSTDANALQQVLVAQGLWSSSLQLTSYDQDVVAAVTALQEKYATQILMPNGLSSGTGYFGPSTRSFLNNTYGCNSSGTVSTQVFQCPTGWVCTPPAATVISTWVCPTGWTCVPTSSITTVSAPMIPYYPTTSSSGTNSNSFFSLAGTPIISITNVTPGGSATAVLQYRATFNVIASAVTGPLVLGLPNSSQPAFSSNPSLTQIYKDGIPDASTNYAVTVSYFQPANTTLSQNGTSFTVSQGQSVTIPVTYSFIINKTTADTYAVQLQGIYSSLGLINSMMNQPNWRTQSI
jgi:hypothetical protein